ncbi:hypothetical protein PR048_028664 [Dryococelus australis]|uniref:Uncharacterized protein n=1 Tax=Dryococelus australis TaxID=614101 RepID=A0ABQ9GF25_9NEOP|nr:hypothetical protein PR048_028664 [Dryococelus australis]
MPTTTYKAFVARQVIYCPVIAINDIYHAWTPWCREDNAPFQARPCGNTAVAGSKMPGIITSEFSLLACHQDDPGSIPGRATPDFRMWESRRTMPLVGGPSRGSPVSPPLHSGAAPLTSITLIGPQDLDVKSHPNPFTQLH